MTEFQNINLHYTTYKVNKPRHEQCAVTPHFSTGQTLLKKNIEKRYIDIINSEKLFDRLLITNNAIHRNSFIVI